ncbi:4Fe-4S dicluster domain-containing protein [Desulfofundulus thermobenzoicus]|uniref:4Fe-4S dicluster domain-containing protein n=1 Tax=Desulfofundulus thermobenzoicus TaxID=29376 RepID=A0A6N7ISX6_9FIRM|nr:4Fe-4S binding protein [Desulfofundulus thermobenzoicus]MQL52619.1 4Fe-4S dicluster domain-containing protein [Desulfofundulus thermobenzoicus]
MRAVTLCAVVDVDKCKGCTRCERVCPVLAIKVENKKAVVDPENCLGCANCEQRCPEMAITMAPLEQPRVVQESLAGVDMAAVADLCRRAHLHPKQIVCYCTATRAGEVAAAILKGAKSPEEISRRTGVRTGCKVECIQPVLRLLHAAGIAPERPARGYQWYGLTPTVWEIPEEVKKKYAQRGFYFDEDRKLLDSLVGASAKGGE